MLKRLRGFPSFPFPFNVGLEGAYAQANAGNQHCGKGKEAIHVFMKRLSLRCVFRKCFLGVILDEKNLTWKHHIDKVGRKVSKSIGIIYKSIAFAFQLLLYVPFILA